MSDGTEVYNAQKELDKTTWFNHLMLDSDIVALTERDDFDPKALEVSLKINGEVVRIEDFNAVLNSWADRIYSKVASKLELNESNKEVERKAKALVEEKLHGVMNTLSDVENSLWKLEGY